MSEFTIQFLSKATWTDFASLVEKNNGVWGGCWCMAFHDEGIPKGRTAEDNKHLKECRVKEDRAHASLVYDEGHVVGWCQFGRIDELPRFSNRREYLKSVESLPDWRITCFFVDRQFRGMGVSGIALEAALQEMGRCGGGVVEGYPEDTNGRSISSSFLHNGTLSLFERHGFVRERKIGKNRWVVKRTLDPG